MPLAGTDVLVLTAIETEYLAVIDDYFLVRTEGACFKDVQDVQDGLVGVGQADDRAGPGGR